MRTVLGRQPIDDIAMEFAIESVRDKLATCQEIQVQLERYQEMSGRVGRENADAAIAKARQILNMMGLETPNQH